MNLLEIIVGVLGFLSFFACIIYLLTAGFGIPTSIALYIILGILVALAFMAMVGGFFIWRGWLNKRNNNVTTTQPNGNVR